MFNIFVVSLTIVLKEKIEKKNFLLGKLYKRISSLYDKEIENKIKQNNYKKLAKKKFMKNQIKNIQHIPRELLAHNILFLDFFFKIHRRKIVK